MAERGEAAVDNYGVVKLSDLINLGKTLPGEVEQASQYVLVHDDGLGLGLASLLLLRLDSAAQPATLPR